MSRYRWNYKEIIELYKDLQSKLKKETDPNKRKYLTDSINAYKQLLYTNRKQVPIIESIEYEDIDIDYDTFINKVGSFYKDNVPEYIDLLTEPYSIILNAYNYELDQIDKVYFSNQDLIDIVLDFLKEMTPNDFYLKIKTILEKNNSFLNITYNKDYTENDNVTLFDKDYNKKFILVTRHNDLLDFRNLPHELSHYLLNDCNHDDYNYSDSKFLLEVEGCLIDLLFSEYYQRHHKEIFEDTYDESGNIIDDGACLKYKFLGDIIEYIKTFIIKNEFLMSLNDNLKIDKDVFYERTIDYGITDTKNNPINTMYILSSDEEKFLKYGMSYLVAFDLYDMCLKDPEYAFYNLTNIKKNKDVDNLIPYLRNNNITFMDNDYNSLKKYIKNMTD